MACLFCKAVGPKPLTLVLVCEGEDTIPCYLCEQCFLHGGEDVLGGLWTMKHIKDYIRDRMEKDHVFILYYNSESACDDDIRSVHRTLNGAISEALRLESESLKDDPELAKLGSAEVRAQSEGTKGVNLPGWSVGTYNIYRVPFNI
jgi:hypothetical protein